jgi:hypothetical protein
MFRDRVVSMEQTLEGGEKHLEFLKGICREAFPEFEYREHALDFTPPWPRRTMLEMVAERTKVDAGRLLERDVIAGIAERTGGIERPSMAAGELLCLVFERLVRCSPPYDRLRHDEPGSDDRPDTRYRPLPRHMVRDRPLADAA